MQWYQLGRDESDLFMKGEEVECRIAVKSIWEIKTGDFIMVRLANRQKFKATVKKTSLFSFKDAFVGEIIIKKTLL